MPFPGSQKAHPEYLQEAHIKKWMHCRGDFYRRRSNPEMRNHIDTIKTADRSLRLYSGTGEQQLELHGYPAAAAALRRQIHRTRIQGTDGYGIVSRIWKSEGKKDFKF